MAWFCERLPTKKHAMVRTEFQGMRGDEIAALEKEDFIDSLTSAQTFAQSTMKATAIYRMLEKTKKKEE